MTTPQQQANLQKEGRLELELQAYQSNQFWMPTAAAKAYDVPRTTLLWCIRGVKPQLGSISKHWLLMPTEEETLLWWILLMDQHSMMPRISTVHDMAALLVAQRVKSSTPPLISHSWVHNFINCHLTIKSKYNRKIDYQRAKCDNLELICGWFQHVQTTVMQYGIHENNIYNFDETGFQMGVISTSKVITGSNRAGRPRTTQPGNCEWVTVIKTICAWGMAIPLLIIFKAVMHQTAWY